MLRGDGDYVGVDMSEISLANARVAAAEERERLAVQPRFIVENAEALSFKSDSIEAIVSIGALHHSASTENAVAEIRRVLRPGGTAYVFLYRTYSPKLLATHALRAAQRLVDGALGTDRALYRAARALGLGGERLGTAVYECFGVPILRSYTRRGMARLFDDFESVRLTAYCVGLPPAGVFRPLDRWKSNPLGYLWMAEAIKKTTPS
jgi:SAM-dependent methyltransferase